MPNDGVQDDTEIIHAAYAARVGEAFKIFAENIAIGQSEHSCLEHFMRAVQMTRKTRDLALQAMSGQVGDAGAHRTSAREEAAAEPLSAEDQALVDQVLAGTTGAAPPPPPVPRYRGR